jgi:DNA-binding beta-propeller fold protein YncE
MTTQAIRRKRVWYFGTLCIACTTAVCVLVASCGHPAGVIFPPLPRAPFWPAPPEPTRIRYVGQIATSDDLKPAVPFTQAFGEAVFGKGSIHSMLTPYALCTDGADRLFVADSNAQLVHVFDLATRKYETWKPQNPEKRYAQPVGITYSPAGRLYVADSIGGSVYAFDRMGKYLGRIGTPFVQRPCGLAFDAQKQRLFIADAGAHQVIVLSPEGNLIARVGSRGTSLGQFNFPTNVAVDGKDRLYVSDSLNFRVQQFGADLRPIRQIGKKGDLPGYFGQPKGLSIDSENHLYVVDANFEAVQIFDDQGQLLLDFGQEGRSPGMFWLPAGIFIDHRNRIWVADCYNRRVQVFQYLPENGS